MSFVPKCISKASVHRAGNPGMSEFTRRRGGCLPFNQRFAGACGRLQKVWLTVPPPCRDTGCRTGPAQRVPHRAAAQRVPHRAAASPRRGPGTTCRTEVPPASRTVAAPPHQPHRRAQRRPVSSLGARGFLRTAIWLVPKTPCPLQLSATRNKSERAFAFDRAALGGITRAPLMAQAHAVHRAAQSA